MFEHYIGRVVSAYLHDSSGEEGGGISFVSKIDRYYLLVNHDETSLMIEEVVLRSSGEVERILHLLPKAMTSLRIFTELEHEFQFTKEGYKYRDMPVRGRELDAIIDGFYLVAKRGPVSRAEEIDVLEAGSYLNLEELREYTSNGGVVTVEEYEKMKASIRKFPINWNGGKSDEEKKERRD